MCDLDRAGTKGMASPALKDSRQRDGDEVSQQSAEILVAQFWWCVGLLLATDRLDLQDPVKNVVREVARATCGKLARARSVVRYLLRKPRLAWSFPAGTQLEYLDAYAESDWTAMETERKSSSCVVIRLGQSVLETSSTTQGVFCLSSGEAELYAATRAATCGIQLKQFLTEIGCQIPLRVHGDSP